MCVTWATRILPSTDFSDPLCSAPPAYVSGDDGDQILEKSGRKLGNTRTVTNVQADFTNVAVVKAVDPNGIPGARRGDGRS